jgi:phosphoribosyl 1,2-cyclic phosphate phosphodiesterase
VRLTLLGTGSASGMPVYGCDCEACDQARAKPELRRTACSALLEVGEQRYLLDAGQLDLAERFAAGTLSGILLTHFHPDHVQGLFHLRWGSGLQIPVYCPTDSQGCADLYQHPGILHFLPQQKFNTFSIDNVEVTPLPLIHSKPTFGYLLEHAGQRLAYLTDTQGLPHRTLDYLVSHPPDLMVIDCTFPPTSEAQGHNNWHEMLKIHQQVRPTSTCLTHIGHAMQRWLTTHYTELPDTISVGRDGQQVFPLA